MNKWQDDLGVAMAQAKKVAVLGAGSVLCGDDAVGMIVAKKLKYLSPNHPRLLAMEGSTAPENFTGLIRDFKPDLLLLVDAAYIDGEVGDIALIAPEDIEGLNFSTHMLPFGVLCDYLKSEVNCHTIVIGIKPGTVDFGASASDTICCAADALVEKILTYLT